MAVIGLTSAKGSPGVTVTALALAWVWPRAYPGRQVLLVDADAAGSGITFGYLRGEAPPGGALGLAGDHRADPSLLWRQLISMTEDDDRWLLLGITDPAQAVALEPAWSQLATRLAEPLTWNDVPVDVVLDLGRAAADGPARNLAAAADLTLVCTRSSLASVAAARLLLRQKNESDVRPLLIGEGQPYRQSEVAKALGDQVLGPIAFDPAAAAVFSDGAATRAGFARSALLRSAHRLAESLADVVESPRARTKVGVQHG